MAVPRRKNLDQRPYVLKNFNVCAGTCAVLIYSISSDNRLAIAFWRDFEVKSSLSGCFAWPSV